MFMKECLSSRLTPLVSLVSTGAEVFLKRDDELSFIATGNKLRKLSAILPYLQESGKKTCVIFGGVQSNSVLSATALFKEFGFSVLCFTWGRNYGTGNSLLLNLLARPEEVFDITGISPADRMNFAHKILVQKGIGIHECAFFPEGLNSPEGFVGAQSLATDLVNLGQICSNTDIFIDAGTGVSAAALVVKLGEMKATARKIHIVTLSESFQKMTDMIENMLLSFNENSQIKEFSSWQVCQPVVGKSFGSSPASVLHFVKSFAQQYGVLLDPVYTAKLVLTAQKIVNLDSQIRRAVIVHGGGGHAISGFFKGSAFLGCQSV